MAKHKRWSDKPKSDVTSIDEEKNVEQETSIQKEPTSLKSLATSATKYSYIVMSIALLSGIFTPLTLGVDVEDVVFGMLSIILGLAGGILIFLGTKNQKFSAIMICGGLGIMIISLILIHELANRSLFGN